MRTNPKRRPPFVEISCVPDYGLSIFRVPLVISDAPLLLPVVLAVSLRLGRFGRLEVGLRVVGLRARGFSVLGFLLDPPSINTKRQKPEANGSLSVKAFPKEIPELLIKLSSLGPI